LAAERARALDLDDEERIATMRVQQQMALATQELRRRVGDRLVDPTQTEVESYYAAHRDDFHHPGEVDLMLIGFSFTDETLLEIHDRARTALDAIDRGTLSFEEARHRYSELAAQGDAPVETLTNLELAGYGPAVGKAVNGLAPGEVSRLIRQDDRLWIVKLVGRRPPAPMSFEEAERTARHKLGQQRVDELAAAIERQVVEDAEITLAGDAG